MEHERFMSLALEEARKAFDEGEIPIGSVLVKDGQVIARAYNRREALSDPTAHAEILVLRQAGFSLGGWRLEETTLYVTVEPCPMCAGALIQARVGLLVYGAREPRTGADISAVELLQDSRFNHRVPVIRGVMESECAELMQRFFSQRRD